MEEYIKENYIRNAYKEFGSLKGGFKPHTNLSKGTNDEIKSDDEDIKNRWQNYFQHFLNATNATTV
jgi:hypothetical protein